MLCEWRLWVDCRDQRKSHKVLKRVSETTGREPLNLRIVKDEEVHQISFAVELESNSWNDAVVEAIALGLRIAHRWRISSGESPMDDQVAAGAQKLDLFQIAGIEAAAWELNKNSQA